MKVEVPPRTDEDAPQDKVAPGSRRRLKLYCGLGIFALALIAAAYLAYRIPLLDTIAESRKYVEMMGSSAGILYPFIYALCNILLLPAGILSILGGFFFGLWWGFVIVLAGNLLGALAAFCISRYLARGLLEPRIRASEKLSAIDKAIAGEGWKIIFLSQLHPLFPTSLLNYLYGVSRIRLIDCMAWIALGQTPGLFLYVYIGTLGQHGLDLLRGENQPAALEYLVWISGLLLALAIAWIAGRIALKALDVRTSRPD